MGSMAENWSTRCARMRLVWKGGPWGSRRQATPGVLVPVLGSRESSTEIQRGADSGRHWVAAARRPANSCGTSKREAENKRYAADQS